MKKLSAILFSLLALTSGIAAASQPLAFDFMVTGSDLLRPVLVFHDGENTYIQPPDNIPVNVITVKSAEATQYGPYIMVKGVPKSFTLSLKKEQVSIIYMGAPLDKAVTIPEKQAISRAPEAVATATPSQAVAVQASVAPPAAPAVSEANQAIQTAKADACPKRIERSEAAYVVGVDFTAANAPPSTIGKLRAAITPANNVDAVYVSFPQATESVNTTRVKALTNALVEVGVAKDKIHNDFKGRSALGAELRIIRSILLPCTLDGIRVEAPHRGSVTVIATADGKEVVERLAGKLGIAFRTEGTPVPLPITISETEVPLIAILQKIGNGLNPRAIVISRPNELVIRYRATP